MFMVHYYHNIEVQHLFNGQCMEDHSKRNDLFQKQRLAYDHIQIQRHRI